MLIVFGGPNALAGESSWPKTWQSEELREHPLVGRIFAPHSRKFVTPKEYLQSLVWPRFVLLGEIHDNPDHHILQALAVRHMAGGPMTAVFEHFRADQQAVLDAYQAGQPRKGADGGDDQIERLFLVTGWAGSGWPDKGIFRPLIEAVLSRNARLVAGNPPRKRVFQVARRGLDALAADAQKRLFLDKPLGDAMDETLLGELEASHCGLMPKSAFGNMAVAQRLRDGHMAQVMADAALSANSGAVALLAGNGHVRRDRGVPWYLRQMIEKADERPLLAVGHVEVVAGKTDPHSYVDSVRQFSLVVFTPRKKRSDPCIAMRNRFKKKR